MINMCGREEDAILFGMLLNGLSVELARQFPGGKIERISFCTGMVGAYRIEIHGDRKASVFAKRGDVRPAANGNWLMQRSGVPAPRATGGVSGAGSFSMIEPLGKRIPFGFENNILNFEGQVFLDGEGHFVEGRIVDGIDIFELEKKPGLMNMLTDALNRKRFFEEMGYAVTAAYATGTWDRNDGNLWVSAIEIMRPEPRIIANLETRGHWVFKDARDRMLMLKFASIDNDSAATYYVLHDPARGMDLGKQNARFADEDLWRIINAISRQTGLPKDQLHQEAFGGSSPAFTAGAMRWMRDFGSSPRYRQEIHDFMVAHSQDPAGVNFSQNDSFTSQMMFHGIAQFDIPCNGDPYYLVGMSGETGANGVFRIRDR